MHDDLSTIGRGWAVLDANDDVVGEVAESAPGWILVRKGLLLERDVYLTPETVAETDGAAGRVYLTVSKAELERIGLEAPPPVRGSAGAAAGARSESVFAYGITATDATAQGNVRSDVLEEAGARADALFPQADEPWERGGAEGGGDGGAGRFERTSIDDLAGVEPREGGSG